MLNVNPMKNEITPLACNLCNTNRFVSHQVPLSATQITLCITGDSQTELLQL